MFGAGFVGIDRLAEWLWAFRLYVLSDAFSPARLSGPLGRESGWRSSPGRDKLSCRARSGLDSTPDLITSTSLWTADIFIIVMLVDGWT